MELKLDVVSIQEFNALKKEVQELKEILKKKGHISQEYLRSKDVLNSLKISKTQLKRLRDSSKLKYIKKDGTIFYLPEAVEEFINNN